MSERTDSALSDARIERWTLHVCAKCWTQRGEDPCTNCGDDGATVDVCVIPSPPRVINPRDPCEDLRESVAKRLNEIRLRGGIKWGSDGDRMIAELIESLRDAKQGKV